MSEPMERQFAFIRKYRAERHRRHKGRCYSYCKACAVLVALSQIEDFVREANDELVQR